MTTPPALPSQRLAALIGGIGAIVVALLFTALVMIGSAASPAEAFGVLLTGAFSTPARLADATMLIAPLTLCAVGLTLTFGAGVYNLGVDGQMTFGAIVAMAAMRASLGLPPPAAWALALLCGALGGVAWGLLGGWLKVVGRVNEIFAGLGLNFVATGVALYLVAGPWRKQGTAAITSTELLPQAYWLPVVGKLRVAPLAPALALLAVVAVWVLLSQTRWGLAVRATGLNPSAARRLGVPSTRRLIEALAGCGALAGVAGALQVLAVFHALIPNISSGIGLVGLLVALLARANPLATLPIAILFGCFSIGAIQLPLKLGIDSSIAGVLQGALVLFVLMARGVRR